jgi:uncharacterized repeat protein (TIGR03803 family)
VSAEQNNQFRLFKKIIVRFEMRLKRTENFIKMSLKSVIVFLFMASASLVGAQTLQTICSFSGASGALTLGNDGNFYGTTSGDGSLNQGTIFQVTTNGTLTTLVSFSNTNGSNPQAALTLGNDGNFYGTTSSGGSNNCGTVFQVTTNGTLTALVSFTGGNGAPPFAALTLGGDGNFYGTTADGGGVYYDGTVFKVTTNGTLTTLVTFTNTNGAHPEAALTLGTDGNFYGTTRAGGGGISYGTVFKVTTNGTLTTLVSFNGTNGMNPYAALTLGNDGNFYGTTFYGGSFFGGVQDGYGTVFKMTTNGTLTTLFSFNGTNGAEPCAGLTLGNDGNYYGTTQAGGSSGDGTIFQVTTNGTLTTMVSFNGANGANPNTALTLGNDGNFYGMASGTMFRFLIFPFIAIQPQSQTNSAGATVTFFVSATSPSPMTYQWQKNNTNLVNGGNISGATTNALTITDISDSDAASYSVIVSNSNNSVTNSNALLTVIDPPIITAQPTNLVVLPKTNVVFGVSLTGSAPYFRYQWQFNGTNILNATNASYAISSVVTNNAGNYSVIVTNLAGSVTSSNAVLAVILSPTSQTNYANRTATFTATTFSAELLNYQWQKNGTNLVNGGNISGATNSTLTIANLSDADAAIYSAVVSDVYSSVTTSNATLTVIDPPIITAQPLSRTNNAGSTATFTVTASGTTPAYQWFKGSLPISGAVLATLTLTNVQDADMAGYTVVLTNAAGSATSAPPATLTVIDSPIITNQPLSRTNNAGSTATFTVTASGSTPAYQWFKGSLPIAGAVLATLTLTNVQDADMAGYTVVLTNAAGSATSAPPATLTVIDPPIITAQPKNLVVLPGTNVAFGISLTGTAPLRYQWQFNGTNILNATNAIYAIPSVTTSNAGYYAIVITNLADNVTSSNGVLTVVLSPTSQTNSASSTATFTATAFGPEPLNYQWQKNGTNLVDGGNISGSTNNSLTIANVSDADAAIYSAVVSDNFSSVTTSNAVLTVNDLLFIATQPLSQTIGVGSNVTFTAKAYGAPPLIFQWYYSNSPAGSPTSGTNVSSYTLTNVHTNQSGNYSVQVINGNANVMSSNAVLTVKVFSPIIGLQPASQTAMIGSNVSFNVFVGGTAPFHYQWRFNSANILNATNAIYAFQVVGTTNAGNYSVVVTNSAGSVTSSNAVLTVFVPPAVTLQFLAGYPLLKLNGMLSSNFVVQYNTDLAGTNWINLLSLTNLSASPYQFLDPAGVVPPARFYRAFMQ